MCRKHTLKKIGFIFIIILQFFVLLTIIIWYILPRLSILPLQRLHMRNRVRRKLRKYGMPQDAAKIFANEYKNKLSHYGSFRGLLKIIKSIKSNEVKEDKIDDDNKTTKKDPLYLIDMNKFSVSN